MNRRVVSFVFGVTLFAAGSVDAFDFDTPRAIGMGRAPDLGMNAVSLMVSYPIVVDSGWWGIELGYQRRFDIADLDQITVVGAWSNGRWTLAGGLAQFGNSDLYAEQMLRFAPSLRLGRVAVQPVVSAIRVTFGNRDDDFNAVALGFSVGWRQSRWAAALVTDNLNEPTLYESAIPYQATIRGVISGEIVRDYTATVAGFAESGYAPRWSLGQAIDLSPRAKLLLGFTTAPFEYSAGIDLRFGQGTFSYAATIHPELGLTHTLMLGWQPQPRNGWLP